LFHFSNKLLDQMLISDRHQFIFVHNRKVAGTSMRSRLAPHALPSPSGWWNKIRSRAGWQNDYHQHVFRAHAPIGTAIKTMPAEVFANYFKFIFVRNPWDRLVSEYEFIRSFKGHARHRRVMAMKGIEAFILYQKDRPDAFQSNLLLGPDGELAVDFIGRYERLADDFETAIGRIGIELEPLPHLNRSRSRDYREYFSSTSVELVDRYWRTEIDLLNYSFE
jgi:hypothetical protein